MQLCGSLNILWHCLSLGLEWKLTISSPVAHCWVFQICWHLECSTFTASSFRIWNSLTGIPSPPLALFILILPKAHLTSHSRMSGSRWVIMPLWLSGSWRSFLYSSSVYSCHLQCWIFIGRTDVEAEAPILWPRDAKNWLTGKDPDAGKDGRQEEKGTTEDKMVEWQHQLYWHEFEQVLEVGDWQGSLVCCSPWGLKESGMTEQLNWTELKTLFGKVSVWIQS